MADWENVEKYVEIIENLAENILDEIAELRALHGSDYAAPGPLLPPLGYSPRAAAPRLDVLCSLRSAQD